jgi:hypothetical protein
MVCTGCGAIGAAVNQIGRNVRQLHYSVGIVPKKDHSRAETLTDVPSRGCCQARLFWVPKAGRAIFLSISDMSNHRLRLCPGAGTRAPASGDIALSCEKCGRQCCASLTSLPMHNPTLTLHLMLVKGAMRIFVSATMVALSLGGCLTNSSKPAVDVSPNRYQSYSCQKLRAESYAVSAKASKLTGIQDERRPDAGGDEVAAQLSLLKGQTKAIEQAMIDKKCAG